MIQQSFGADGTADGRQRRRGSLTGFLLIDATAAAWDSGGSHWKADAHPVGAPPRRTRMTTPPRPPPSGAPASKSSGGPWQPGYALSAVMGLVAMGLAIGIAQLFSAIGVA